MRKALESIFKKSGYLSAKQFYKQFFYLIKLSSLWDHPCNGYTSFDFTYQNFKVYFCEQTKNGGDESNTESSTTRVKLYFGTFHSVKMHQGHTLMTLESYDFYILWIMTFQKVLCNLVYPQHGNNTKASLTGG